MLIDSQYDQRLSADRVHLRIHTDAGNSEQEGQQNCDNAFLHDAEVLPTNLIVRKDFR